jgi:hypothetical protein
VTRSAAVALQANTYYRVEVRFIESTGNEYFQVGYAKAGVTAPSAPQAILGSAKPITTGASTPLSLVPDFAGQSVTVTLSAGVGGLIDAGRVGAKDASATVGGASVPNVTIQGDRTDTVMLIGSMSDIQAFLMTEGSLRYSVVSDSWLKVSLTSARLATTTDGVKFTTAAYTAEVVQAVRLLATVPSGPTSTVRGERVTEFFSGLFAQEAQSDGAATIDLPVSTIRSNGSPVAVGGSSPVQPLVAAVPSMQSPMTIMIRGEGQPFRLVTPVSMPLDQAFSGRMGLVTAATISRSQSIVGGKSDVDLTSVNGIPVEELQIRKSSVLRSNRMIRGGKGMLV